MFAKCIFHTDSQFDQMKVNKSCTASMYELPKQNVGLFLHVAATAKTARLN